MNPTEWDDLRRFIQATVETLVIGPLDTQVGFVTYSHIAQVSAALNRYATRDAVVAGIWNDITHLNASTKTDQGLALAATQCFGAVGDRFDHDNLAILLTDGRSHTLIESASNTLRAVADIVAVGIDGADEVQLRTIVNFDDSRWFKVNTFSELSGQVSQLMTSTCRESLFSFMSLIISLLKLKQTNAIGNINASVGTK